MILTQKIVKYLTDEQLIKSHGIGQIRIAHYGIKEIEELNTNPNINTEHFSAINLNFIQNMNNSSIQQGNINSIENIFDLSKIIY
jgi:hypothetical protein